MPLYEYECDDCGVFEVLSSKGRSHADCPECGQRAGKIVSACAFRLGATTERKQAREKTLHENDIKFDLREKYGVEEVAPVRTKSEGMGTLHTIYEDIVSRGSMIKDQMQETAGRNAEKTRAKQKKWLEDAWSRRDQRVKEVKAQKEREKAAEHKKNAISVVTKKK
jgi:putative FmdB family regulatory protein